MIDSPRKGYLLKECAANPHAWHALCACGATVVCLRCGVGVGTVPCACQVPRWSDAELVARTVAREAGRE